MRRRTAVLIVLAMAAAIGGGASIFLRWVDPETAQAIALPAPKVPVVAEKISKSNVPIYLRGVGTVIAYNTVVVRSQIQGQITRIAFTEGQPVRAGDLLAQIDPRPYQAQLDQTIATRNRDQAQLTNAQANLGRYTELGNKGFATPQLLDTQKAQVAQLESAIKADEALIEASQIQLEYTRLTSPISGITGIRQIDVGNIIHPTDPNGLVVVTQIEPISVIFTLPEGDLPKIQEQMAKGHLKVLAYSQDDKIKLDEGTLALVDNEILQTTGTIRLRANFPNRGHRLWPGELVNAHLLLETRSGGVTVASSAVQQGPNGPYVYVVGQDGTVQMRSVTVEQSNDGRDLIDSGLQAEETVVVDGQYRLQPGSAVQLLEGTAARADELESSVQRAIP
ncbi:efflux RND transporter periplasmic adaptor subunit [Pseudorhodoplanes sinuspersici]|uniref:Efflux transporter periplasmic adaptor subunit n=1 Tax=Pseudorhodoplanes sinuspersici TaxID=1235591 RepID=A0A1W6ZSR2_9HYPH|nr:efflux RND transporter periplasmic adaptor subunit [Pseudorhodoplanes sinuspersici]ARQ00318.1 efflux transporter periplasmic adaptor subunit [Pseudorhodoplanes sinuspersici]RKE67524.1 multidrug efflux system membrane fusion protein [Pseudorhodoplanes sinuspersici]